MTEFETVALRTHLLSLVREIHGASADVGDVVAMEDGHAGLTFGFEVLSAQGAALAGYVLKRGPTGVPRRGSTDIYRQVSLLRALHAAQLPVPRVVWASPDEQPLGAPFIVMEKLPGRSFIIWEPHQSFGKDAGPIKELWRQAASALAGFHRFDWRQSLTEWEAPHTLGNEIERWDRLLAHALESAWLETGRRLSRSLAETCPAESSVGLIHGDYQPGNVLYDGGQLVGVIDWDLASIASQGIDVGWLLMMRDENAWAESWKPVAPITREELLAAYREAGGTALTDLAWYQAFAHLRMGAIACLNVKLHRNGRRPDPIWERFAPSILTLFAQAEALLEHANPNSRSIA